mmetsp:Transcript_43582/g.115081  ORF Transcript_43582/g.115081 Transcript_43582/m.115081 type:complete len:240 (+) Transcript_43582:1608-2327(+)
MRISDVCSSRASRSAWSSRRTSLRNSSVSFAMALSAHSDKSSCLSHCTFMPRCKPWTSSFKAFTLCCLDKRSRSWIKSRFGDLSPSLKTADGSTQLSWSKSSDTSASRAPFGVETLLMDRCASCFPQDDNCNSCLQLSRSLRMHATSERMVRPMAACEVGRSSAAVAALSLMGEPKSSDMELNVRRLDTSGDPKDARSESLCSRATPLLAIASKAVTRTLSTPTYVMDLGSAEHVSEAA